MRPVSLSVLILLAALCAGCGRGGHTYEFQSKAETPSGERVKIAYDVKEGEAFTLHVDMEMKVVMEGGDRSQEQPMKMTMDALVTCTDVRDGGDMVMKMEFRDVSVEVPGSPDVDMSDMLRDFEGTLIVGRDGRLKGTTFAGGPPEMRAQMEQMMQNPGVMLFAPFPPEGLRAGEAFDFTEVVSEEALARMMSGAMPGIAPRIQGECVFQGVTTIDGVEVAELLVNLVMNIEGTLDQMGTRVAVQMGMKMEGTSYFDLRTGFPFGKSRMTAEGGGVLEGEGEEIEMDLEMTMTTVAGRP